MSRTRSTLTLVLTAGLLLPVAPALAWQPPAAPASPTSPATKQPEAAKPAPQLFKGLGSHTRKVSTSNPEAQKYFDQALIWTFSFNHDEAIRSYQKAAELDPNLAMAWWGISLCNGPHINNPAMDEAHSKAAWEALKKAESLASKASPVEQALIKALAARYADPTKSPLPLLPEERAPFDKAYAEAMTKVFAQYPADNDVAVLYAESLMDLRPWDLWEHNGTPRPETPKVLAAIEGVLRSDPNHPGANHLYIHAVEASPNADKANAAADRLRTLVPGSGHMVHMPAHIDVRTGRWAMAAEQNRRAIRIDADYRALSPNQGFYHLYMAHNHHFLSYACMMLGRSEEALDAARDMMAGVPPSFMETSAAIVDAYAAIEIEVLTRFGKWDEMLKLPKPPAALPITTCFWHFGRATALAAQNKVEEALREQQEFRSAVARVPEGAMMAINPAHKVLEVADLTLAGEIAFRKDEIDAAVSSLTKAAKLEDDLKYMEPPDWIQPVRHSLGAVLFNAGRTAEAEQVYRDDLARLPENGWSLFGLAQCLEARKSPDAAAVRERFEKAWKDADVKIKATCLCVTPKK